MSSKVLEEAKTSEARGHELKGTLFSPVHFVNATHLYTKAAQATGNPDYWEAAERCAREAAAGMDRIADHLASSREAVRRSH